MQDDDQHQKNISCGIGIQSQETILQEIALATADAIAAKRAGAGWLLLDDVIQLQRIVAADRGAGAAFGAAVLDTNAKRIQFSQPGRQYSDGTVGEAMGHHAFFPRPEDHESDADQSES